MTTRQTYGKPTKIGEAATHVFGRIQYLRNQLGRVKKAGLLHADTLADDLCGRFLILVAPH